MKTLPLIAATIVTIGLSVVTTHAETAATLANLQKAYEGETNAGNRYTEFAKKAEADGEKQAARLFRAAAKAEAIHAAKHRKTIEALGGKPAEVKLQPVELKTTKENLLAAVAGESEERDKMYPAFIKQAEADDAKAAVKSFTYAIKAETEHAKLYAAAVDALGKGLDTGYAVCPKCGFTLAGKPGEDCVVCETDAKEFLLF